MSFTVPCLLLRLLETFFFSYTQLSSGAHLLFLHLSPSLPESSVRMARGNADCAPSENVNPPLSEDYRNERTPGDTPNLLSQPHGPHASPRGRDAVPATELTVCTGGMRRAAVKVPRKAISSTLLQTEHARG